MRFPTINLFIATLLLVGASALHAQDGVQGAFTQVHHTAFRAQRLNRISGSTLAVADFDGDNKLDGAVILKPGLSMAPGSFQIDLHFTGRNNTNIVFQTPESQITVAALDIDHDGDIDLVIEQSLTRKRLQVWINDGHGNFEQGRVEDYPSVVRSVPNAIQSSERVDLPVISLPTQRRFETMLMACHIAGRPPSENSFANSSNDLFPNNQAYSLKPSRAPPLS